MSTLKPGEFPNKDPYEVLGISSNASINEISKAYRLLARKFHPDKYISKGNLKPSELEKIKASFQEIQLARSFLLDAEHASVRKKYDAKLRSDGIRRKMEFEREKRMSEKRKRMRDELKQQETFEGNKLQQKHKYERGNDSNLNRLSKEGQELRQQYAGSQASANIEREMKRRKEENDKIQDYQIRLKWSRKKMKIIPSKHSITQLMSSLGTVLSVELIGTKGNAALVTSADPTSCSKAVDSYADSGEMRATFIGKPRYGNDGQLQTRHRTTETIDDWRIRREMEREQIQRQMEQNENRHKMNVLKIEKSPCPVKTMNSFPPTIPAPSNEYVSPLARLEIVEVSILNDILPQDTILDMKVLK